MGSQNNKELSYFKVIKIKRKHNHKEDVQISEYESETGYFTESSKKHVAHTMAF